MILGGVGWATTQLAKTVANVSVVGTASSNKHEEVHKNGVDQVLELNSSFQLDVKESCPEGFDLIISNQSGSLYSFLQTLLKPLGRIILIGANNFIHNENKLSTFSLLREWFKTKSVSLEELILHNRILGGFHLGTLIEKDRKKVENVLKTIFRLLDEKKICVRIHAIYPISEIVEASKLLAERKNVGKVLISTKIAKK